MRKIVGALILVLAAAFQRADDISQLRVPVEKSTMNPVPAAAGADTSSRRPRARKPDAIPPDFQRNPLLFFSSAPKDSLVLLPGVGPVLAERIINARTGKRSFTRWDDLLAIKGIGPKTVERLKRLAVAADSP